MISWIIPAIIAPVPILHLWLHGLLPFWRRRPILFYLFCVLIWIGSFFLFQRLDGMGGLLFLSTSASDFIGRVLMILGTVGVLASLFTLGLRRFFMYAVFKPEVVPRRRISRGPFAVVPHPAYFGYLLVILGNLFRTGTLSLAIVLAALLALTPMVIWLEERELKERLGGS